MSRSSPPIAFVIGALALAQAICWGVTFNLSAITGVAMAASLGVPYVTVMAGPTVMLVVMALVAVPFLQLFERFGARRVMTASTGIGALGLTLVALSTGAVPFFLGWLIVGIAGAGMLTTAVQIALAERTGPGARQAIGALMVFGGLSTALCWPLLGLVQAAYGWRGATLAGAAALLILAAPIYWWLLVPRPVREAAPAPSTAAAPPLFAGLLAGPGSAAALGLAAALSLAALGALLLLALRHRHGAGSEKSRQTLR